MRTRLWVMPWLPAVLALLAGCNGGGNTYVTQFPRWEHQRYERIAVLPGRAAVRDAARDAGILTDRLTTLLTQNGAFTVLSRSELKDILTEQDLSRLADAVDAGTALPEGQIKAAQAVVATKITDYKLIADKERRTIPRYAVDKSGRPLLDRAGRPIIAGEDVVWLYTHGAEVEASVSVIDAATSKILLSHTARIAPRPKTNRGAPPSMSPQEIAAEAVRELAEEFYNAIAPTRTKVKLGGDMLIVATDYFDGRYSDTKKLPRSRADFLLVVRKLPPECERNHFRVAISEKDGRENIFEEKFVWSGSAGPEGVSYRIPMLTLTETGAETFVAKLYSGRDPEPILRREFSLEKVKAN